MLYFEWDPIKNMSNLRKHGVAFDEALQVFSNQYFAALDLRRNYGEVRWIGIGVTTASDVLVVAFTRREKIIRIISARRASKKEARKYYESTKVKAKNTQKD